MTRRAIALVSASLACCLPVGLAAASGSTIKVSPNAVQPGDVVRVFGHVPGCPRGDRVTLMSRAFSRAHEFAGVPAVFATVGARGAYSVKTRIPARRKPAGYTVTGRCGGGNLGVSARLQVLPPMTTY